MNEYTRYAVLFPPFLWPLATDEPYGYRDEWGYWQAYYGDVATHEIRQGSAHSLIAKWLYRGTWPKGAHVHHRDKDKDNNRWDNLIFPLLPIEHVLLEGKQPRRASVYSPYLPVVERLIKA